VSIYRKAAKIDANQQEIVEALRKIGCLVWYIRQPFDLLVRANHQWYVLEVKNLKGKKTHTTDQQNNLKLLAAHEGSQDAIYTVYSIDDAIKVINGRATPVLSVPPPGTIKRQPSRVSPSADWSAA
jgi:hypothetical protein